MNIGPNDVLHFVLTIVNYGQPKPLHNISVSYSLGYLIRQFKQIILRRRPQAHSALINNSPTEQ